jgi:nitrite reductase/ring-hydroxylating ferredoxin subunit/Fe-S cluster biogenesis protein NfuA
VNQQSLESLVRDLERLEEIVASWDEPQRLTVQALRHSVESIQREAFRRIIAEVKGTPEGMTALRRAVNDPWVFGVLQFHQLLRKPEPSVEERIEAALETVRPMLKSHEGDVALVAFVAPDEAQIRMLGTCNGCAFSDATVKLGVEKAILDAVPEVERVTVIKGVAPSHQAVDGSPFAVPWEDAGTVADVPEGSVIARELTRASVLLTRHQGDLKAYPNACAHLGMPLEMGEIADGVITCTYHGFQFLLETGECLTAPEIALPSFPVRVRDGRVEVQVTA